MAAGETHQTIILSHSVLAGLTPLIPVPFLDDMVKNYFQRRLVRQLAAANSTGLTPEDARALADEPSGGCLKGCVGGAILYPLKKIFSKIFFFLEWKRAVDLVSRNYYHGHLIDFALAHAWVQPLGPRSAAELRKAIDLVCSEVNTSVVEQAVRGTISQSRASLRAVARLITRGMRRTSGPPSNEKVSRVVEAIDPEEQPQVIGIVSKLRASIEAIPVEHFRRIEQRFSVLLEVPDTTTDQPDDGPPNAQRS